MAIIKHNNQSISNVTAFPSAVVTGKPTLISTATASSSSSIEFTSGIDSTYDVYKFELINCHPATDNIQFEFNLSTDSGSNYNVTKTSTFFRAYHTESGSEATLLYSAGNDLAQSTSFQRLSQGIDNDNDASFSGQLYLFNPSSTVFVKHFMSVANTMHNGANTLNPYVAGYGNTTSAVNAIKFQMSSGNIDAGTIKMYGI